MHGLQRIDTTLKRKTGDVLVVGKDGSMSGPAYAVLAVIQNSTKMSLATTARMKIVTNVSMRGSCERS